MSRRSGRGLVLIGGGLALVGIAALSIKWGLRDRRSYVQQRVFGEDGEKRVLVAYASRCGATMDIASVVAEEMASAGWRAELMPASAVESLEGYDAYVLGSGVRRGQPYAAMTGFVKRFAADLQELPGAVFCVSLSAALPDETMRAEGQRYADALGDVVGARMAMGMAGVNDPSTMAPILGFLLSHESVYEGMDLLAPGDYRDWQLVCDWTAAAVEQLSA